MTVYVTNYSAGNPKVGPRLDTDCITASSWHRHLDPRNMGPIEFMGVTYNSVALACRQCSRRLPDDTEITRVQYRLQVLGFLYSQEVVKRDAFTRLCNIYDENDSLILRDRDATPWHPNRGTMEALFREGESITHSHVLAALLTNDPIVQWFGI